MAKVLISGYLVRIREKNKKEYSPLRNFDGNSADFSNILYEFLDSHKGFTNIDDVGDQKTIYYGDLGYFDPNKEIIKCKSFVGSFGNGYDVVNHATKQIDYNLVPDDSYAFPLNFMIYIPSLNTPTKMPETGIMIFEKFKKHGGKGLFEDQLRKYFSKLPHFKKYLIEIQPFIPRDLIEIIRSGKITSTTIRGGSISGDISDSITMNERGRVELTFKNASITDRVRNFIADSLSKGTHIKLGEVFEGPLIDTEEISFDTEYHDQKRKIVLKEKGEVMTPSIDVTDKVLPLTSDGYPDDGKLYRQEFEYIEHIKKSYNN